MTLMFNRLLRRTNFCQQNNNFCKFSPKLAKVDKAIRISLWRTKCKKIAYPHFFFFLTLFPQENEK